MSPGSADDAGGSSANATSTTTSPAAAAVPAVHEVQYDEHGQTWDVYGAEFDPQILGHAIQTHLERIMQGQAASAHHDESEPTDVDDDVMPTTSQSEASVREKRTGVLGSFFQRYIGLRARASAVNSWSPASLITALSTGCGKKWTPKVYRHFLSNNSGF